MNPKLKTFLQVTAFILLAVLAAGLLDEGYFWGVIAGLLLFMLYRIYIARHQLVAGMEQIEAKIWGKPLRREYWKKGELKNTKVIMTWKKNQDSKDQ